MSNTEYEYWRVDYLSCEGNKRWAIVRTPAIWDEWQLRDRIQTGGVGDDLAEILNISVAYGVDETDYDWDYVD